MTTTQSLPTISVAMATYNGCPYLEAQLNSIAVQTLLPDEIVIGDDQSTDETKAVIRNFIRHHPSISVRFDLNSERVGSPRNFEKVVKRCQSDLVVFADQDDIWLPDRLAHISRAFAENPQASYTFSNALLMDSADRPISGTLFSSQEFTATEINQYRSGEGIKVLLRRNVVIGASLAVRRQDLLKILPFEPDWGHDYYIALVLEALGPGIVLETPLFKYRLHQNQQVGLVALGLRGLFANLFRVARKQSEAWCRHQATKLRTLGERLTLMGVDPNHPVLLSLAEKARFFDLRADMRLQPHQSITLILQAWRRGDYQIYSLGWKQAAIDEAAVILGYVIPRLTSGHKDAQ